MRKRLSSCQALHWCHDPDKSLAVAQELDKEDVTAFHIHFQRNIDVLTNSKIKWKSLQTECLDPLVVWHAYFYTVKNASTYDMKDISKFNC